MPKNIPLHYQYIHDWFDECRIGSTMEQPYLERLAVLLENAASRNNPPRILDSGCGTGEPIARFFIERGMHVTGIDATTAMIETCRQRFAAYPHNTWHVADMRDLSLSLLSELQQQHTPTPPLPPFDAVIAWHSLFHLPHEDQRQMFARFASVLAPGGLLMVTAGGQESEGEIYSDMQGHSFYHATLAQAEYAALLAAQGFTLLIPGIADPECGDATIWLAQKQYAAN